MKKIIAIFVIIGILSGSILYNIRVRTQPSPVQSPTNEDPLKSGVTVSVTTARNQFSLQSLTLIGAFKSDQQATISSKIPQKIASILVREGDHIRKGDPLVQLDASDSVAAKLGATASVEGAAANYHKAVVGRQAKLTEMDGHVADAEAGLNTANLRVKQARLAATLGNGAAVGDSDRAQIAVSQAQNGLDQAKVNEESANVLLEKLEFLLKNGGTPRSDVDTARNQWKIAHAQTAAAELGLTQAKAARAPASEAALIRPKVSQADIDAATAGVHQAEGALKLSRRIRLETTLIADREVESAAAAVKQAQAGVGQVNAQAGSSLLTSPFDAVVQSVVGHRGEMAQPGQPILTISDAKSTYFEASAPASKASLLKAGQSAEVTLDSHPNAPLAAEIEKTLPISEFDGRSVPVRIRCEPSNNINIGSPGKVVIELTRDPQAVTLPLDAVRNEGSSNFVYVVENGLALRRQITLGAMEGETTQVIAGIKAGDLIVVSGPASLQSGMKVRPVGL